VEVVHAQDCALAPGVEKLAGFLDRDLLSGRVSGRECGNLGTGAGVLLVLGGHPASGLLVACGPLVGQDPDEI
jgi:hypothetical protein